jgi:hypothetical protein
MGKVKLPVPVWMSGENVSPIPCSAPPPCGVEIVCEAGLDLFAIELSARALVYLSWFK